MNNDKSYIVIQNFMIQQLKLKGNELIIYALIHGFSQDGTSFFYGSLQYIQDATNLSKETVLTILQRLTEAGLLIKTDTNQLKIFNTEKKSAGCVHFVTYYTAISRGIAPTQINFDSSKKEDSVELEQNTTDKTQQQEQTIEQNFYQEEGLQNQSTSQEIRPEQNNSIEPVDNSSNFTGQVSLPEQKTSSNDAENCDDGSRNLTRASQEILPVRVKNFDPILNSKRNLENSISSNSNCINNKSELQDNKNTSESSNLNSENKFEQNTNQNNNTKSFSELTERESIITKALIYYFGNLNIFEKDFVKKIDSFCTTHNLTYIKGYIKWTVDLIMTKQIDNFPGYFYKTICSEQNVAKYLYESKLYHEKQRQEKEEKQKQEVEEKLKTIYCPCCEKKYKPNYEMECPDCGLSEKDFNDTEKIAHRKKYMSLPKNLQNAYDDELFNYMSEVPPVYRIFYFGTPERKIKYNNKVLELDKKYGLA